MIGQRRVAFHTEQPGIRGHLSQQTCGEGTGAGTKLDQVSRRRDVRKPQERRDEVTRARSDRSHGPWRCEELTDKEQSFIDDFAPGRGDVAH
jgi:hypothetical protein